MATLFVILGYIFTVLGFGGLLVLASHEVRNVRARSWPTVDGIVISSGVDVKESFDDEHNSPVTNFHFRLTYEYEVDGSSYTSHRLKYGETGDAEWELERRHLPGLRVTVYYNPRSPQDSVLQVNRSPILLLGVATFGCLLIGAIGILLVSGAFRP